MPTNATYFQSLIGVLGIIVELGRAYITMETYSLASMMESPREGHIKEVFHMFAFLKRYHNRLTVFDPTNGRGSCPRIRIISLFYVMKIHEKNYACQTIPGLFRHFGCFDVEGNPIGIQTHQNPVQECNFFEH